MSEVDVSVMSGQITVIDCELEIGQDLYSSFLRGIYKGQCFRFCAHLTLLDRTLISTSVCLSVRLSVKRVHPDNTK